MSFEPGVAYWFNACIPGGGKFLAVATEREDGEITFIEASALLVGRPQNIDGRETVIVTAENGREYFASSAAFEDVHSAARILNTFLEKKRAEKLEAAK
jgi:hypothetical protein